MVTATMTSIVKQVKKLSSSEQQELRAVLDALLAADPALTEKELHRRMAAQGRISVPSSKAGFRAAHRLAKPVAVKGKAVSRTIIEERR